MQSITELTNQLKLDSFSDVSDIICKMAEYIDELETDVSDLKGKMDLIESRSNLLASSEERYYG